MAQAQPSKARPKNKPQEKSEAAKKQSPPHVAGSDAANEGEGNKTAARRYNQAAEQYAKSPRSDAAETAAKRALDGPEREELERAEKAGRDHATDVERESDEEGLDAEREGPPARRS